MTWLFWYCVAPNIPTRNVLLLPCIATEAHYLTSFLGVGAFLFFHRCPRPLRTCRGFAFRTPSRILCSTACRPATTRSDRTQFAPSYSSIDRPTPCPCEQNSIYSPAAVDETCLTSWTWAQNVLKGRCWSCCISAGFGRCHAPPRGTRHFRSFKVFFTFTFSKTAHGNIYRCRFSTLETYVSDWTTELCLQVFIFMPEWILNIFISTQPAAVFLFIFLKTCIFHRVYLLMLSTRIFTHWQAWTWGKTDIQCIVHLCNHTNSSNIWVRPHKFICNQSWNFLLQASISWRWKQKDKTSNLRSKVHTHIITGHLCCLVMFFVFAVL